MVRPSILLAMIPFVACAGQSEPEPWASGPAERVDVRPTGDTVVADRLEPVPVSGCYAGGDTDGRNLLYAESTGEVRQRSVVFEDYDTRLAQELDLPPDPARLQIDVGAAFGIDPAGHVSSGDDAGLFKTSGYIPAGSFGVFYRQTVELHRLADLVAVTASGDEYKVGELALVDWDFLGGIGVNESCPPFPAPPDSMR